MNKKIHNLAETLIGFAIGTVLGLIIFYIIDTYYSYEYYYIENLVFHGIDEKNIKLESKNEYYRNYDFEYVQTAKTFFPKNHQDVLNIYYDFLNSGEKEITFYCPKTFKNCLEDVNDVVYGKDNSEIGNIYLFNHPYNDYKTIQLAKLKKAGQITIRVKRKYTKDEINEINNKVNEIYNELYDHNDTEYANIKKFHDYLLSHSTYDQVKADYIKKKSKTDSIYHSDSAYGPLIEGRGICSGYTDAMLLFLEKLNLKNYRVSTETHVWNAVELGNHWYHIDLTWDEGRYTNGKTFLRDKYFLISTKELLESDSELHNFDQSIFKELKP